MSRVRRILFRSSWQTAAFAVALFFLILGAKWAYVDRAASDIPDWDQWDAEGLHLLTPWFAHADFWPEVFSPQNEHRVVLTKLQNLALTLLNGQWDARLECVANAILHTSLAVAFFVIGSGWLAPRWRVPWFVVVAACFGLPIAWQNLIGGFHSQQYWLLGLSFTAIAALPFARPWSAAWWTGAVASALALLAMGSGFFAAVIVLGLVILRFAQHRAGLRECLPAILVCIALCTVAVLTRVDAPWHAGLKAKGVGEFFRYVGQSLQWPEPRSSFAAVVLWLPWLGCAWQAWRQPSLRAPATLLGLGGWVLLQILATAYARGAGAEWPVSRYMDTLAFGLAVNGLALVWQMNNVSLPRFGRMSRSLLATGWAVIAAHGLYTACKGTLGDIAWIRDHYIHAEENVRRYLATDDPFWLDQGTIPYPSAAALRERLNQPELRRLMPVSIRAPLPLTAASGSGFFVTDSRTQAHVPSLAPWPGLSPNTPPFALRQMVGSAGGAVGNATAEWTSAPLTPLLGGWLKFETAGDLGRPGVSLELHDAGTGALLTSVRPTKVPGDTWRAAYVRAPPTPFVIVARAADAQRWLAFSAPVEMSMLSYWAWQAVKNGLLIVYIASGATLILAAAALFFKTSEVER